MEVNEVKIGNVLTRSSGYLERVCSHSLQPYRGCAFGTTLCGVGCYVQHSIHLTQGRPWGKFLDVRSDAASAYLRFHNRERDWARRVRGDFVIFLSSATEPFPPQERRFGATSRVLHAMIDRPPDGLIIQTHGHQVLEAAAAIRQLATRCRLRVHISIETDRESIPGLPPPASSVERRFAAAKALSDLRVPVVITVSPLLPIADPPAFFSRIARSAGAVVLDHFIGGDGTPSGWRTRRTPLPQAMADVDPASISFDYLASMGEVAERYLPGRVGYGIDGFAGRFGAAPAPA